MPEMLYANSGQCNLFITPFSCFSARPTDFDFLAVIGKGTFGKVKKKKYTEKWLIYLLISSVVNECFLTVNPRGHVFTHRSPSLLCDSDFPFLVGTFSPTWPHIIRRVGGDSESAVDPADGFDESVPAAWCLVKMYCLLHESLTISTPRTV